MSTSEHNTCETCMFYDPEHAYCDKQNEDAYPDFECNDWKEKVKSDENE